MSRSNPAENAAANPSTRWFEWNGEKGIVRYYDKENKENIDLGSDFGFVLLDELGSVRGWHDASGSGIFSNEVKDTRADVMIVKAFKGGTLAEGLYKDIKDRVNAMGGQFVSNCYIAFKGTDGALVIGSIRFKGAALGAWMEFRKQHRADLFTKGIRIHGATEGKKGRITFYTPIFKVTELSEASNAAATKLDQELQSFLASYLKRTKTEQVQHVRDEAMMDESVYDDADIRTPLEEEIGF